MVKVKYWRLKLLHCVCSQRRLDSFYKNFKKDKPNINLYIITIPLERDSVEVRIVVSQNIL